MKRTWIFLINTFIVVTAKSYLLAQKIMEYHSNALALVKTDPFFQPLYDAFAKVLDDYNMAFTEWKAADAAQMGNTQRLLAVLSELSSTYIESWDIQIQSVFKIKTPDYKVFLPRRRKPFQKGGQFEKLQAVKNLALTLAKYPELSAVYIDVQAFLAKFDAILDTQKQSIQNADAKKALLEAARISACEEMYSNLGLLMSHYKKSPESIAVLFPLAFIRQSVQLSFTNSVKPLKTRFIAKRTMLATDAITIFNTSKVPLSFYFAQKKNDKPDATAFTIQPNDIQSITAAQLGDLSLKNILVYNPDALETGSYQFDID